MAPEVEDESLNHWTIREVPPMDSRKKDDLLDRITVVSTTGNFEWLFFSVSPF